MEPWEADFRAKCIEMARAEETVASSDTDGLFSWQTYMKCPKGHRGVMHGHQIDIGDVYLRGDAQYCPNCDHVYLTKREPPTFVFPHYLEILNKKVKAGATDPTLLDGDPCPTCGKPTKVIEKAGSFMYPGFHRWQVCTEDCGWPGSHQILTGPSL